MTAILRACLVLFCVYLGAARLHAHPMPNTHIAVSLRDDGVTLEIAVPLPELLLALPESWPEAVDLLAEPQRSKVETYFLNHCSVLSNMGVRQPLVAQSLTVWQASDENVGQYKELRLRLFAAARQGFDPRDFILSYDAVIHRVPNHFALVQIVQDFRAGVLSVDDAPGVGVIRFDFKHNTTPPLPLKAAPGNVWRGFRNVIGLGFFHVTTGLDHVLFLLTLLIVAPLTAAGGRWSLFQGWNYALRRFLAISVAFTLGHSVALLAGVYTTLPVPRQMVEVLIAASILLAAIHAIHPLFLGREWIVAAGFGTVHGLAFSESLAGLNVTPAMKALAVLGFNLGVEGAQLVVMACALPILFASRWSVFHTVRISAMILTAVLASVWMFQRAM